MLYRCTTVHDIRLMGTVNGKKTINLIFHSKITLVKVSFPFCTFFFHPEFEGRSHHIPPLHTSEEAPENECACFPSPWSVRRGGHSPAHGCFFCLCGEDRGYRNYKVWYLVRMRFGRSYLIATVNLISTHSTHANRVYWVEGTSLLSHTQDQCIRGWSSAKAKVGHWPLLVLSHCWPLAVAGPGPWCASSTLLFSHKCAICCQNCAFGGGGSVSPAWLLISKYILILQLRKSRVTRVFIILGHEHHDEDLTTREVDPSPKTWVEYEEEMNLFFPFFFFLSL